MALDPRTPVLVGVGQVTRHPTELSDCPEPAALMEMAARAAGDDSGTGDALLRRAGSIRIVQTMSHAYSNPAANVAARLGATPRETAVSAVGGNSPQQLVNGAAADIAAGRADVVLIAGAEAIHSRHVAHRAGAHLPWPADTGSTPPDRVIGDDRPGTSDAEQQRSLLAPVQVYPVFESALRASAGETIEEHQTKVSELWESFSRVAASNPYAWDQRIHTASEIRTPSPQNRWIGWPYTKLMVAYAGVDMAASLLLTSVEAARSAGVPEDRWVFPWAGSDAHDHWFISERHDLCSSPAIAANGRTALGAAGISIDDVTFVDLYSCFPAAVEIGAAALGLGFDRDLTVTGGLSFCGGPLNNYVTHAIASMAELLRARPEAIGLVTALGWYATKHSLGLYSATPPAQPFTSGHPQDAVDATPSRQPVPDHAGPVTVEAWAVMFGRDGAPTLGIVACLTPAGGRTWANVRKPDLLAGLTTTDIAGRSASLLPDGELEID